MFRVAYRTDVGLKRSNNQDAILVKEDIGLCIVADGMGGHKAGEIASSMTVDAIEHYVRDRIGMSDIEELIQLAIKDANRIVYLEALKNPEYKGMGTTCSLIISEDESVHIGHVGDSRIYYVTDDKIIQITEDHTLVEKLIKSGEITRAAAETHPKRNVIMRAVGTNSELEVDFFSYPIKKPSRILICSDGLTGKVKDHEIFEIINEGNEDIQKTVDSLVQIANDRGGADNISVILMKFAKAI